MITGGTGSFGNAVLKRFLDTDIKEIRIFSRDEKKQDDMRNLYKNDKIKYYIGDVRDFSSVEPAGVATIPMTINMAVSGDDTPWQCYHYKVFEAIAAVRNAGWRPGL